MTRRFTRVGRAALAGGAVGLVLPALLLLLWEVLARFQITPPNLLPTPFAVLKALSDLAVTGELPGHIEITLLRVLLGFLLGTAVATVLGALTGYSPLWRRLLDPLFQSLRSIPSMAWIPLFVLWLGIFEASKVTLIAVGAFFPVYLNTMAGIQQVDRKLVEVAEFKFEDAVIPVTVSIGVASLRGEIEDALEFIKQADTHLFGAKEGGRNRVVG